MADKQPICTKHGIEKRAKYNSSLFVCPACAREQSLARIAHNKSLLKGAKTGKRQVAGDSKQKTPRQKAMDRADRWFSRYIRISKAFRIIDGDVICQDIITGKPYNAKHIDNGHLFSRQFKTTRFEPDNCWPQNRSSNRFSGEADHYKFRDKVLKLIGDERFNRIDKLRKQTGDDSLEFYTTQADKYQKLVTELINKHNIKKWWK